MARKVAVAQRRWVVPDPSRPDAVLPDLPGRSGSPASKQAGVAVLRAWQWESARPGQEVRHAADELWTNLVALRLSHPDIQPDFCGDIPFYALGPIAVRTQARDDALRALFLQDGAPAERWPKAVQQLEDARRDLAGLMRLSRCLAAAAPATARGPWRLAEVRARAAVQALLVRLQYVMATTLLRRVDKYRIIDAPGTLTSRQLPEDFGPVFGELASALAALFDAAAADPAKCIRDLDTLVVELAHAAQRLVGEKLHELRSVQVSARQLESRLAGLKDPVAAQLGRIALAAWAVGLRGDGTTLPATIRETRDLMHRFPGAAPMFQPVVTRLEGLQAR